MPLAIHWPNTQLGNNAATRATFRTAEASERTAGALSRQQLACTRRATHAECRDSAGAHLYGGLFSHIHQTQV